MLPFTSSKPEFTCVMSVFQFESGDGESSGQEGDVAPEDHEDVKTVSVLESDNGDGYSHYRATIPAEFAREMDLSGGDTLFMELREDGIFIPDHS